MSKTVATNTIIGTIAHSETETMGGCPLTTISIPHTFWYNRQRITTDYHFTFHKIPENNKPAFQEDMVVQVDFYLVRDEYTYQLKPTRIKLLGEFCQGGMSTAGNRITGPIRSIREGTYKNTPNIQVSIPHDIRQGGNIETTWMNFTYWNVSEHLKFLYQSGNLVSIDYCLIHKDEAYDIRPCDSINVLWYPKRKQVPA
ncbi:MAG: hypothetical protein QNK37_29295 [Acidobacteriota bacterium]|nr:hypothetical protein [Acidobacteriota bacterium]